MMLLCSNLVGAGPKCISFVQRVFPPIALCVLVATVLTVMAHFFWKVVSLPWFA